MISKLININVRFNNPLDAEKVENYFTVKATPYIKGTYNIKLIGLKPNEYILYSNIIQLLSTLNKITIDINKF